MSISFEPLFAPMVLTGTITRLFAATATTRIDKLTVANSLAGAVNLSVFIVTQGMLPNQGTQIVPPRPIQPMESWDVDPVIGHVLVAGDALWALASVGSQLVVFGAGTVLQ